MKLAVVCDLLEEEWPSMDLCAEALVGRLVAEHPSFQTDMFRPPLRRRATRLTSRGLNFDRFLNRFLDYPRSLRRLVGRYDAFHIVDHSYAHLVHELPSQRTGVFCHDLDTFRCLLGEEVRPRWFRAMTRRILLGLEKAAVVFCTTETMEAKLANLIEPRRIVRVALGTAPEFHRADDTAWAVKGSEFLLHVGSCIPRKRIDVLLETFAGLRKERPELRLVQVGGAFTPDQTSQAARLGVAGAIDQRRGIDRSELADLYRSATIVLQPSEREGFAIPVIEALACGARVLASDIPVLREVGGDAVVFSPVGDVASWVDTARCILNESQGVPTLETRLRRAATFSWSAHAATVAAAYTRLVG